MFTCSFITPMCCRDLACRVCFEVMPCDAEIIYVAIKHVRSHYGKYLHSKKVLYQAPRWWSSCWLSVHDGQVGLGETS